MILMAQSKGEDVATPENLILKNMILMVISCVKLMSRISNNNPHTLEKNLKNGVVVSR